MENVSANMSLRNSKSRKDNLITRKNDKSPEKAVRSGSKKDATAKVVTSGTRKLQDSHDEEGLGSMERLDRPKKIAMGQTKFGLNKTMNYSKTRNLQLPSARFTHQVIISIVQIDLTSPIKMFWDNGKILNAVEKRSQG